LKFLIPPSEGKSTKNLTNIHFKDTNFVYQKQVNQILRKLKDVEKKDLKKIYGTNEEKAKFIHKQNLLIKKLACSPAIERYSGTVFSNIKYESFSGLEKEFFYEHFLIFSGLFGAVKPHTLIPNYKLKMNVLQLYKLWNPVLTKDLKKEDSIFDLLPQIHKKAYNQTENIFNLDFVIINNGKKIPAGHFGKVIKGKFIHFIIKHQIAKLEDLIQFEDDGFKWDGKVFLNDD